VAAEPGFSLESAAAPPDNTNLPGERPTHDHRHETGATEAQIEAVKNRIAELGYQPHPIYGVERTVVAAVGREDKSPLAGLETMPGVESAVPILKPYKLVSRETKPENTSSTSAASRSAGAP
jgi:hypothetical protein